MLLLAVPGACFVGQQGPILSRVLYGTKWAAMDPLIWPGALIGLSLAVMATASGIVMAAGQLRTCLAINAVASTAGIAALAALLAVHLVPVRAVSPRPAVALAVASVVFGAASFVVMRVGFRTIVGRLLLNLPAGGRLRAFLLFRPERQAAPPTAEAARDACPL